MAALPPKRTCGEPAPCPQITEARAAALKALQEAEQGWKKAIDKIIQRASVTKVPIRGGNSFFTVH
jgi:hypothetical protein